VSVPATTAAAAPPPPVNPPAPAEAAPLGWGQKLWNLISIGGCAVVAGLWYWYSGMAETKPDIRTCIAIVALPVVTTLFRSQIDNLLRPLQPVLGMIPRMVRLGIGLAIPYLIASYLYSSGNSEFRYMFKTVVWSTLLSYVLLRVPSPVRGMAEGVRNPA